MPRHPFSERTTQDEGLFKILFWFPASAPIFSGWLCALHTSLLSLYTSFLCTYVASPPSVNVLHLNPRHCPRWTNAWAEHSCLIAILCPLGAYARTSLLLWLSLHALPSSGHVMCTALLWAQVCAPPLKVCLCTSFLWTSALPSSERVHFLLLNECTSFFWTSALPSSERVHVNFLFWPRLHAPLI